MEEEQPQVKVKKPFGYDFFKKPAKMYRTQNAWLALLVAELNLAWAIYRYPDWVSLFSCFLSGYLFFSWLVDKELNKLRGKNLAGLLTINHLLRRQRDE